MNEPGPNIPLDYPPNSLQEAVGHLEQGPGPKVLSGAPLQGQELQFFAYALELFSELTSGMAGLVRHPDKAKGIVALRATQLASALRNENHQVLTEWERKLQGQAIKLYLVAKDSAEGRDPGLAELQRFLAQFDSK